MLILLTLPSFTRLGKLTVGDDTDSSELLVRDSGSMFIADRQGFEVNGLLGNRGLPLNGFILLSFWRHADWVKSNFFGLCLISSFLGLRNSATLIGLSCTRCLFVNLSKDPLSSLSSSINFLLQGRRFPLKMDTLLGSSFFKDSLDWVAFWLCEELTWVFGEVLDSQVFIEGDIIGDTRDSLTAVAFMLEINVWLDFSVNFCSRPSAETPISLWVLSAVPVTSPGSAGQGLR